MANPRLKAKGPRIANRTVPPIRPKNADLRTREYLIEAEVEKLMGAAKGIRAARPCHAVAKAANSSEKFSPSRIIAT